MSIYHDEVEIEDFEYDEDDEMYYYPCPCGDRFQITKVKKNFINIAYIFIYYWVFYIQYISYTNKSIQYFPYFVMLIWSKFIILIINYHVVGLAYTLLFFYDL